MFPEQFAFLLLLLAAAQQLCGGAISDERPRFINFSCWFLRHMFCTLFLFIYFFLHLPASPHLPLPDPSAGSLYLFIAQLKSLAVLLEDGGGEKC